MKHFFKAILVIMKQQVKSINSSYKFTNIYLLNVKSTDRIYIIIEVTSSVNVSNNSWIIFIYTSLKNTQDTKISIIRINMKVLTSCTLYLFICIFFCVLVFIFVLSKLACRKCKWQVFLHFLNLFVICRKCKYRHTQTREPAAVGRQTAQSADWAGDGQAAGPCGGAVHGRERHAADDWLGGLWSGADNYR